MSKVARNKIRVGVLFGGRSAEHEVSLRSAKNVIAAIDKARYDVVPIAISKQGTWISGSGAKTLLAAGGVGERALPAVRAARGAIPIAYDLMRTIDVVFPVLHGTHGEDGTMQGLLTLADVPFVGPGVLGSAVGMDKDVMKRLLREAGIPTADSVILRSTSDHSYASLVKKLGLPFFIKPANLGSSVGVHKIKQARDFTMALADALRYDTKVLAERFIPGREIECSVIGNEKLIASLPGEIRPSHEFYTYEAKYLDPNGAALEIPAALSKKMTRTVQSLAIRACKALCLEGMARVDFFLTQDGAVYVNELNTLPGFTSISMYPKLWEASGISQKKLVDKLIRLPLPPHS